MFDFIRKHTRVLFFFLVVLIIPSFVFFGLQGYTRFNEGAAKVVADVGGIRITQAELDAAHREQVERIRRQSPTIDSKLFDTPEMRAETLESLIRERLLALAAEKQRLVTTDDHMRRQFQSDPQFAFLRNPDGSVNSDVLAAQGMTSEIFAQRLRQDMSTRQVLAGVEATAFAPSAAASAALDAFLQQREVKVQRFDPASQLAQVQPTDAELEAYYKDPKHAAQFQAPEQVDIEYLVLDADKLQQGIRIDDEELRQYYSENASRYTTPPERRASHILVKVDPSASADERAKAKAKAEALLAQARSNPDGFAELARRNSDDPGSAQNGGDLDFFGKGAMVKPFEESVFALPQPGAISDLVSSDFGYHIIKLTGVRGGEKKSFEQVRPEIEALLRKQLAQKKYTELAVEFGNTVYEQSDSLKPAADKLGLQIQTATGLTRVPAADATGPLASPKLLDAIFSSDAIRAKRNTDAIETAPTQMVSARVTQHSPAHTRALAEVRDEVKARVITEQSAALAHKAGQARLAELKAAPATALDVPAVAVSRIDRHDLPQAVVDAALRAPAKELPAVLGVDLGLGGYAVVKVEKVLGRDPKAGDPKAIDVQFERALAEAQTLAYYNALKKRYKVEIKAPVGGSAASAAAD